MTELTLESLAERVAALERELHRLARPSILDWRDAPRTPEELEFAQRVDAEGRAWREAERQAELERLDAGTAQ
ncbi:MAG: hypothetical protein U0746_20180 [Gemmataceae bacterium]